MRNLLTLLQCFSVFSLKYKSQNQSIYLLYVQFRISRPCNRRFSYLKLTIVNEVSTVKERNKCRDECDYWI